ncbi:acyltransferase [Suicoccus acidiformans]|uniref:Acyltransferase n=1 Tax=Suicoccus acidiformans TaxID=2036206 RepID=A0A347WLF7_9LACT|nr:acyltransferase family protein [Suicoccus acidiformans]AXY25914.1 acyltransferase [Suicoccus acidiformans]
MKQSNTQRLDVFDGLKGLAILLILGYYFFQHIVPGGYLAVNLFLVIAGFFNFRHFYIADSQGKQPKIRSYYRRRFERLFFPMLAMIVTVTTFIMLFAREYFFNIRNMALSGLVFLNNYYQIFQEQSYFVQAANPSAFTHLWYVSLLGQLLLLTPIAVKLFYSWNRRPAVAANFLLVVSLISAFLMAYWYPEGGDPTRVYYDLLTRASAYTFGGALGFIFPAKLEAKPLASKPKLVLNGIGLIAVIMLFLMVNFMYGTQAFAYRFGMTLFTLTSGLLIIAAIHPDTIWHKLLSFKPLAWLGRRSFSYYLWYYAIYLVLPTVMGNLAKSMTWLTLIQMLVLIIVAEFSYQIFEQQRIQLPLGQHFNLKKSQMQFNFLKKHPQQLTAVKVLTGIYAIVFIIGSIGVLAAPESRSDTAEELQSVIVSNEELADQTQDESTQTNKVINNIEGLDQEETLYASGLDVTFVGDSILLAAAEDIQTVFPKAIIQGEVGRQLYRSVDTIEQLKTSNLLQSTVVTMLGSNGTFTQNQLDDYIQAVGTDRDHYFVTANVNRPWNDDVNRQLFNAAQRYGNVHVIDWETYANDHPEWMYEDGAHPNKEGAKELAVFIAQEVYGQR